MLARSKAVANSLQRTFLSPAPILPMLLTHLRLKTPLHELPSNRGLSTS
jgi:hypothetical protein